VAGAQNVESGLLALVIPGFGGHPKVTFPLLLFTPTRVKNSDTGANFWKFLEIFGNPFRVLKAASTR
jgi:hypothetical protein